MNYKYPESLELLHAVGSVTYPYVLNMVFIDTELSEDELMNIYGVTYVKTTKQRLYNNKMKSDDF